MIRNGLRLAVGAAALPPAAAGGGHERLWLAVVLVFGLGAAVAAFLWTVEGRTLWWHSDYRYAVVAAPVLLRILFREGGPFRANWQPGRGWWRVVPGRAFAFVPLFLALNVGLTAFPSPYGHVAGMGELTPLLRPGDVVGVHGLPPDVVLPHVKEGVSVIPYSPGFDGAFLVTTWNTPYEGFTLLGEYGGKDLLGDNYHLLVWTRVALAHTLASAPP